MSEAWSREEVEAAVADYFSMLTKELKGEPYSKAEHNRHLQSLLADRTRGSVERKHQNIWPCRIEGSPRRGEKSSKSNMNEVVTSDGNVQ